MLTIRKGRYLLRLWADGWEVRGPDSPERETLRREARETTEAYVSANASPSYPSSREELARLVALAVGGELIDGRDYLPPDPPDTIY